MTTGAWLLAVTAVLLFALAFTLLYLSESDGRAARPSRATRRRELAVADASADRAAQRQLRRADWWFWRRAALDDDPFVRLVAAELLTVLPVADQPDVWRDPASPVLELPDRRVSTEEMRGGESLG